MKPMHCSNDNDKQQQVLFSYIAFLHNLKTVTKYFKLGNVLEFLMKFSIIVN